MPGLQLISLKACTKSICLQLGPRPSDAFQPAVSDACRAPLQAWLDICAEAQAPAQADTKPSPIMDELQLLNRRLAAVLGEALPQQAEDSRLAGQPALEPAVVAGTCLVYLSV